jgi:hypothetical protein
MIFEKTSGIYWRIAERFFVAYNINYDEKV